MKAFRILGGKPLNGEIDIRGAKNAVLPLLAAVLLVKGEVLLRDCPRLKDIDHMLEILSAIGCQVRWEGRDIVLNAENAAEHRMP
ncbi:MAG: UDP-N-acetylglucosamine 1-carboxyvinyltransferase, partial [Christensenellaceae bacterium]|nr:UDP-N-acetylglucosamine 1-carboxyvinyltransferase [Christensenellaceae bacterium]